MVAAGLRESRAPRSKLDDPASDLQQRRFGPIRCGPRETRFAFR